MGNVALEGFGSGGTSLNFKVVGGETQPSTTKENTIWVNTAEPITSWIFSATEPEAPETGMVWISIGTASVVAFNALKKNGLMVYPIAAKQYIGNQWIAKEAKSYQGGEWVDWVRYLYQPGDKSGWDPDTTSDFSVEYQEDCLYSHFSNYYSNTSNKRTLIHKETVDLTNVKTITVNMKSGWCSALPGSGSDNYASSVSLIVTKGGAQAAKKTLISNATTSAKTFTAERFTIDVSGLSGEFQVAIQHSAFAYGTAGTIQTKIYIADITME